MSDIALKPAATLVTYCLINVDPVWPVAPKQPGLKSVDYAVLGALQQMVYQRRQFTTINQLKQAIVAEWGKLLQRLVDRAIGQWRRQLECVVQQQGGHIEHFDVKTVTVTLDNNLRQKQIISCY